LGSITDDEELTMLENFRANAKTAAKSDSDLEILTNRPAGEIRGEQQQQQLGRELAKRLREQVREQGARW